ncbi:MAG TPA: LacI family DNA-binding transcriptional regulator [Acidobacteriota bacterium]|nr:LacI family DNA-binding transcriptional regulator [Acidobacteriota bacterium]
MDRSSQTPKRVTLKDIAERVGVSPSTVSLVLSGAPRAQALAAETRAKVTQAAEELGYRPNYLARSLRGKRTFSVGVLVPEFSEGYSAGLLSGVESQLDADGYSYLMVSHRSRPAQLERSMRLLEDRGVEGLILIAAQLEGPPPLPCVVISGHRPVKGSTSVVLDHGAAVHQALSHLSQLGHRRIAYLKGSAGNVDAADRWRAIEAAASSLDLEIDPRLVLQLQSPSYGESFQQEGGYQEGFQYGRKLLDTGLPFTALFAFNDISAIGATRAFLDAGLKIPEDLSIIGFDDLGSTPFLNPPLTTIRQPLRQMGQRAARLLLSHLDSGADLGATVSIQPELIVRSSTGPSSLPAEGDGGVDSGGAAGGEVDGADGSQQQQG